MFASSALRHARVPAVPPARKLLRPYDLSLQLKRLSANGDVNAAVERLRSVPRDAQNVPVWNTMLSLCMSHKKFQLAYTLFTDMKRRGFSPNISTFATVLKGLSQISDWSRHPRQLANAHALYHYYLEYTQSIKHHDPSNTTQLSLNPLAIYISILGAAGDIQKMFDVYFAMDHDGPHAPDRFVFTAMFRAISNHQERAGVMSVRDAATSDAKHVWLQVEKIMQKRPDFNIDSRLIAAAIHALARGRQADQNIALDIIARHLGLTGPSYTDPFRLSPHLNSWTLDAALQACSAMQKFRLGVHFMHLIMDNLDFSQPGVCSLVNRSHIHKLLGAHASLATPTSAHESSQALNALEWCLKSDAMHNIPDLCPSMQTYHLVLTTCLRTGDWEGTLKSFELMTGIRTNFANDSESLTSPRVQKRPEGRHFMPNVETMSLVMRTAEETKDDTKRLHALWLAEYVGIDKLLASKDARLYYRASFARALASVIDRLSDDPGIDRREWLLSLKARTQRVARSQGHTSRSDECRLGSLSALSQEDSGVSPDLTARAYKPHRH